MLSWQTPLDIYHLHCIFFPSRYRIIQWVPDETAFGKRKSRVKKIEFGRFDSSKNRRRGLRWCQRGELGNCYFIQGDSEREMIINETVFCWVICLLSSYLSFSLSLCWCTLFLHNVERYPISQKALPLIPTSPFALSSFTIHQFRDLFFSWLRYHHCSLPSPPFPSALCSSLVATRNQVPISSIHKFSSSLSLNSLRPTSVPPYFPSVCLKKLLRNRQHKPSLASVSLPPAHHFLLSYPPGKAT